MVWGESAAVGLLKMARQLNRGRRAYVFAVESAGSIGDQAMADVIRRHLGETLGYAVHAIYMPDWTPSPTRGNYRTVILERYNKRSLQAAEIFATAKVLIAVGADVIDGNYGPGLPMKWLSDLALASRLGICNGAINFSISETPNPQIRDFLQQSRGTHFVARDPVSRQRFEALANQSAALSADLAFLLEPEITSHRGKEAEIWVRRQKEQGRVVLGVNASGHTLAKMGGDGAAAYAEICGAWLRANAVRSVLLMPHDYRPTPVGDVEALDEIAGRLAEFGDRVFMVRPPFSAWEIKALAGSIDLALTGRMHLAIAAFGMGAPSLCVAYQGKFEGLMQHLDVESEGLLVDPPAVLDVPQISARLDTLSSKAAGLRQHLIKRMPEVQSLARQNLAWLPTVGR